MINLANLPVKLGEPKRLASIGFGTACLMAGVGVKKKVHKCILFGMGLVALSMTIAGFLNPVTVHPGHSGGKSMYHAGSASDIGTGRTQNTFSTFYGAEAVIPAGPATNAQAAVQWLGAPLELNIRDVTGVENEGHIIGQEG